MRHINPINGIPRGLEVTSQHCLDRAEWEWDEAARLRVAGPVGRLIMAEGHERAAADYERRATQLTREGR
jgi:hypothetical protein